MHHQDDHNFRDEDMDFNDRLLTARYPKGFRKDLTQHYADRVQQVIQKGLQYSAQYFFVRNRLWDYKNKR